MALHPVLTDPNTHAAAVTVTGAAASATFWGLKVSDLGVMVSSLVAVMGLCVQVFVFLETRRHNKAREEKRDASDDA